VPYSYAGSFDAGNSASGTTLTVSATYTAGEHVFIRAIRGSLGGTETITDGTNTYTAIGSSVTTPGDTITHYECVSTAAGTFTVTQTLSAAAAFRGIQGLRYTGLDTSTSLHAGQFQSPPPTTTDATSSGNLTPSSQPGILIGWSYDFNGSGSTVAGTGFTSRSTFTTEAAANGSASRAEDQRLTSTAAVAATFTTPGATGNVITSAIWCAEAVSANVPAAMHQLRQQGIA